MRAFTLVEILLVILILGVLLGTATSRLTTWVSNNRANLAAEKAAILDLKKARYLSDMRGVAVTAWASAPDDETRYQLIRTYILNAPLHLGVGLTEGGYTPKGYYYRLNGLTEETIVYAR